MNKAELVAAMAEKTELSKKVDSATAKSTLLSLYHLGVDHIL